MAVWNGFSRCCSSCVSRWLRTRSISVAGKDGAVATSARTARKASALCLSARPVMLVPSSLALVVRVAPISSSSRAMPRASRAAVPSSSMAAVNPASPGRAAGSPALPARTTRRAATIGSWWDSTR